MLSRAYFGNIIKHNVCPERFIQMAKAMGMENATKAEDFLTVLEKLLEECHVADLKMSDYGITPDEFRKWRIMPWDLWAPVCLRQSSAYKRRLHSHLSAVI